MKLPDSDSKLAKHFMAHQVAWINAERELHEAGRQVVALAEKSVRIGWTYADAFKNVRKRILFKRRDYLFATKDYPSAVEYVRQCYKFAEIFDLTRSIVSRGEESLLVNRLDEHGRPLSFTEEVKIGVIKFDNGSRIIAFSANPQAMAVYGGDVGLDEFAKHPNARLLWETAQGRVTWNYDLAIWSAHDGEDTLFNEFAQEARGNREIRGKEEIEQEETKRTEGCGNNAQHSSVQRSESHQTSIINRQPPTPSRFEQEETKRTEGRGTASLSATKTQNSKIKNPPVPWNVYFRVTLEDAIRNGLVEVINRARGTRITAEQFLADCRARARDEEIFEQSYMCNPLGAACNHIVEWSAIERCRQDYQIERVHLEGEEIRKRFGEFAPGGQREREGRIGAFVRGCFAGLFGENGNSGKDGSKVRDGWLRLGFDVAASGQGDLACIYIDEARGDELWLRGLFTCRTEDWHFLKTVLFYFLENLEGVQAAGDETGLGRQICWEAANEFGSRFLSVNFASKKHELGFALMNQLSVAEKRFPRSEQDIAADYFALRKTHNGSKWVFSEGRNTSNPASHCDLAWAGALATHAHTEGGCEVGAMVLCENGWLDGREYHPFSS